jgi:hypothetical protein
MFMQRIDVSGSCRIHEVFILLLLLVTEYIQVMSLISAHSDQTEKLLS